MKTSALLLIAICAACVHSAAAEEPALPAPTLIDTIPLHPGAKAYPQELAARGVQGKVTLRANLSAEGKFSDAAIQESSRSEALDAAALDLVPRLKYTTRSDKPVSPGPVLVALDFVKDQLATLRTKTCADFNQDTAYFKEKFPEAPLAEMPVFKLLAGVFALSLKQDQQLIVFKNLKPIEERVVQDCGSSPDTLFLVLSLKTAASWKDSK